MSDRPELIGNRQTSNKPDWTIAPEDAQFYSCGHFRKHENGVEYVWADDWEAVTVDPIDWHKKTTDFEMRPESSEPEWDGKGLPPVGAVCEVYEGSDDWLERPIVAHDGDIAIYRIRRGVYGSGTSDIFRPIKSDRDKWIDAADQLMKSMPYDQKIAPYLYDALKSGKLPTP